jgi:hypothetical protein
MLPGVQQYRNLKARYRQDGLGRTLNYVCKRLDLDPIHGRRLTTGLKTLGHPKEHLSRRRVDALVREAGAIRVPHGADHLSLPAGVLPGMDRLLTQVRAIFARKRDEIVENYEAPYGLLLTTKPTPRGPQLVDIEDWAPTIEFASQPQVAGIVAEYLGQMPVLSIVTFAYTLPGTSVQGSQLFHCDKNHDNQLHLVIPVEPIDEETGPFTFLPGDKSEKVLTALRYRQGRVSDEDVFRLVEQDDLIKATGDAGSAFFVNPSRCLHFGARASRKPRLMLILNFTCYNEGAEGLDAVYRSINRFDFDTGDSIRRGLLRL